MINVYAWPPVGVVGSEWTEVAPVARSRSMVTGKDYLSAAMRKRRHATLEVSGIGSDATSAGYVEVLKRYLAGIHAVRLYSYPINFAPAQVSETLRQSHPLQWQDGGTDLDWTAGGQTLLWYDGTYLTGTPGTDAAGFPSITVSGLPASILAAKPGEFITVYADENDATGTTVQIANAARSDAAGVAVIRLFAALPAGTDMRTSIGTRDTGVFRPLAYPRAMQPVGAGWSYSWEFYEVFADEVGGFNEVDPWR